VLGGWAWLTSVTLAVIGRPSKNVGLQFGETSATDRCRRRFSVSPINVSKCEQTISRYRNVSVQDFIRASKADEGDEGSGDICSYKTCKAPVKSLFILFYFIYLFIKTVKQQNATASTG